MALAGLFRHFVTEMVVKPQSFEYRSLRAWLGENVAEVPFILAAVEPEPPNHGYQPIHEFGRYSSDFDWSLHAMLLAQLAEVRGLAPSPEALPLYPECVEVDSVERHAHWYHGTLVDMRVILGQLDPSPLRPVSEAPLTETLLPGLEGLGPVGSTPSGWVRHAQLGWFRHGPGSWILHDSAGWIALTWIDGDFVIFYSHTFGKVWTELGDWPRVHTENHEGLVDIHSLLPCQRLRSD